MYQATTPTLRFAIPYSTSEIEDLKITLAQGVPVFNFGLADVDLNEYCVSVGLTQEQTSRFKTKIPVDIQMRIKLQGGVVVASQVISIDIHKSLNLEVL